MVNLACGLSDTYLIFNKIMSNRPCIPSSAAYVVAGLNASQSYEDSEIQSSLFVDYSPFMPAERGTSKMRTDESALATAS